LVKIYRTKSNKLIVNLPDELIKSMKLSEGQEVEFLRSDDGGYIVIKKDDSYREGRDAAASAQQVARRAPLTPSQVEIAVLKKIDTLRYQMRTVENVNKLLTQDEKAVMKSLLQKKFVNLFNSKDGNRVYSISKDVYDNFLMRKKSTPGASPAPQLKAYQQPRGPSYVQRAQQPSAGYTPITEIDEVATLEKEGYIVLQSESQAAAISSALEESIRKGHVLGTRAFNRKFYIVLRSFMEKNGPQLIKLIGSGTSKTADLSAKTGIDEEGIRAILYLLSESGEVSEKRKDAFTLT
jgi:bifunctional DNA-binding transcriptional regulator/antitoxin component of YhaV-PrlF toxin-antitoxin module